MIIEKKYQVAISKNDKGEIEKCLDVEIVNLDKYKAYKKESSIAKSKNEEKEENATKDNEKKFNELRVSITNQNLIIAKCFFDNEVASGYCDTNNDFENAFRNFVYRGVALEIKDAPKEYQSILERLG